MNKKFSRLISAALCGAVVLGSFSTLAACKKKQKVDALVIMSEEVDGLFNPFFATTGADMEIVGMTQIGMLTTEYDANTDRAVLAYGDDQPVVTKDFAKDYDEVANQTTYTFVLKNNLTFSDGQPLTMEDVLFNMYVYLDPAYTGSSTMYSVDIVGLQEYRTQSLSSSEGDDDKISQQASAKARARIQELINLYKTTNTKINGSAASSYDVSEADMKDAIQNHTLSNGYKDAVSSKPEEVTNATLLADYERTLQYFKEELESDYKGAKDSFTEEPYKSCTNADGTPFFDEVTSFMAAEGFVSIEYNKKTLSNGRETDDKSSIKKVSKNYGTQVVVDKESAIKYVYDSKVASELHYILNYWATGTKLRSEYAATAKGVIINSNLKDGELVVKNISGITSVGHNTNETSVNVNGTDYKIARDYNSDGSVKNSNEYEVLRIKIKGVDPKAQWNFGFTVAPAHYYAEDYVKTTPIDIENNKFGVEFNDFAGYMQNVLQSTRNVKVPVGAGAYMATNDNGDDNPDGNEFNKNNIISFKANHNFLLGVPKTEKIKYQVVSSSNALNNLETGYVHFVTPQYTKDNIRKINNLKDQGFDTKNSWQLGYGYIGVSATHIKDINHRKAIMAAMDTSLAIEYYDAGTANTIAWPMSIVSWAYPKTNGTPEPTNGHDYTQFINDNKAIELIEKYTTMAGGAPTEAITFTIAGSNLTEHPTYNTFKKAAELLGACGWNVEVVPDTQALTKLSTGALAVWAAAWGSTVDPDMYQVYHKNSTATSIKAWGFDSIKDSPADYSTEPGLLSKLSDKIDDAREIEDETKRTAIYREAMSLVLDLAVELPVYQRKVLYAYNSNVIKTESLPETVNPYSSPLGKIWEVEINDTIKV